MDKIYRFFDGIVNLNEGIESLVKEDINIKEIFTSIIEWEKHLQPMHIPKNSKKYRILLYVSLNRRELEAREIQVWTKKAIEHSIRVWEAGTYFIEEFDLPGSKPLREEI